MCHGIKTVFWCPCADPSHREEPNHRAPYENVAKGHAIASERKPYGYMMCNEYIKNTPHSLFTLSPYVQPNCPHEITIGADHYISPRLCDQCVRVQCPGAFTEETAKTRNYRRVGFEEEPGEFHRPTRSKDRSRGGVSGSTPTNTTAGWTSNYWVPPQRSTSSLRDVQEYDTMSLKAITPPKSGSTLDRLREVRELKRSCKTTKVESGSTEVVVEGKTYDRVPILDCASDSDLWSLESRQVMGGPPSLQTPTPMPTTVADSGPIAAALNARNAAVQPPPGFEKPLWQSVPGTHSLSEIESSLLGDLALRKAPRRETLYDRLFKKDPKPQDTSADSEETAAKRERIKRIAPANIKTVPIPRQPKSMTKTTVPPPYPFPRTPRTSEFEASGNTNSYAGTVHALRHGANQPSAPYRKTRTVQANPVVPGPFPRSKPAPTVLTPIPIGGELPKTKVPPPYPFPQSKRPAPAVPVRAVSASVEKEVPENTPRASTFQFAQAAPVLVPKQNIKHEQPPVVAHHLATSSHEGLFPRSLGLSIDTILPTQSSTTATSGLPTSPHEELFPGSVALDVETIFHGPSQRRSSNASSNTSQSHEDLFPGSKPVDVNRILPAVKASVHSGVNRGADHDDASSHSRADSGGGSSSSSGGPSLVFDSNHATDGSSSKLILDMLHRSSLTSLTSLGSSGSEEAEKERHGLSLLRRRDIANFLKVKLPEDVIDYSHAIESVDDSPPLKTAYRLNHCSGYDAEDEGGAESSPEPVKAVRFDLPGSDSDVEIEFSEDEDDDAETVVNVGSWSKNEELGNSAKKLSAKAQKDQSKQEKRQRRAARRADNV